MIITDLLLEVDDAIRIDRNWADILRVTATMAAGTMRPSQILRKLERSLFMIEWTTDPDMRRRAQVGLNKARCKRFELRATPNGSSQADRPAATCSVCRTSSTDSLTNTPPDLWIEAVTNPGAPRTWPEHANQISVDVELDTVRGVGQGHEYSLLVGHVVSPSPAP